MKQFFTYALSAMLLTLFSLNMAVAQTQTPLDVALRYMEQQQTEWGLDNEDLSNVLVSDQYVTRHNGLTHIYFVQRHGDIEVINAVNGVHVKPNGQVIHATNRFLPHLAQAINTTTPQITPEEAIISAIAPLDVTLFESLRLLSEEGNTYVFGPANVANSDMEVKLMLLPNRKTGQATLVWNVIVDQINTADYWSIQVDATTGEIVDRHNYTVYCDFTGDNHEHTVECQDDFTAKGAGLMTLEEAFAQKSTLMEGSYRVFPVPVESPIHGDRELVVGPADAEASPFGWHDTDFMEGAEYTITRGNNVHAYLDLDNSGQSQDDEPDGGEELVFDFLFSPELEPDTMRDAAVTQLFYMNNVMHDFTWHYGFDEAAGNFQATNSGPAGAPNDYVLAEAQDGGGENNANFATPPDGGNGRMQMYLWTNSANNLVNVLQPIDIAGGYPTGVATYGPQVDADFEPVQGFVAQAFDATGNPDHVCEDVANPSDIDGKIALINRGSCFFEQKTVNAEAAGAIAVIICNFEENIINMAGVDNIPDPTIPTIMLQNGDCQKILAVIDQGVEVRIALPDLEGPDRLDGDFDNGIMAHEYGHGISNRLTGGPSQAGCLNNDEQMGEGWSDYFSLVTTVKSGDDGATARGIGNYATGRAANGSGIRRLPYSTDMSINDQTYDDIIGTGAPHPLGEVWADVTWDLYWALVDEYGFDEDQVTGTGGNNIAIQLVMDGMKLQPCNPGLIDGRDAILAADLANNDGANQCLIWEVFSRRGLGWSADQGSSNDRNDNRQAFDPRPSCIKELKIVKTTEPNIEAGDAYQIILEVRNDKDSVATGVVITDDLPDGLTYDSFTAPDGVEAELVGNQIQFTLGDLEAGDNMLIFYTVVSDEDFRSNSVAFEGAEETPSNWINNAATGTDGWMTVDNNPYDGSSVWFVPNVEAENDQQLTTLQPLDVPVNNPVFRFYHSYDTQVGLDGGIVQVSTDFLFWKTLDAEFFRNSYRGQIAYGTFVTPNLDAFWGNSGGYVGSYIDMSEYAGEQVYMRFRFGSDATGAVDGWFVDNIEMIEMFNYNSSACITSEQGDLACAEAAGEGTVVEPFMTIDVDDPLPAGQVIVYPNPTTNFLNVAYEGEGGERFTVRVLSVDGRQLIQRESEAINGRQIIPLNVRSLPAGLYYVQVQTPMGMHTEKVSIQ